MGWGLVSLEVSESCPAFLQNQAVLLRGTAWSQSVGRPALPLWVTVSVGYVSTTEAYNEDVATKLEAIRFASDFVDESECLLRVGSAISSI
jgi:hypothetical protein